MPVAALHVTAITARLAPPRRDNIVAMLHQEVLALETELAPVRDTLEPAGDRVRGPHPL